MTFITPTLLKKKARKNKSDCNCKDFKKVKYIEYRKSPPGEINLGLDLKNYKRFFFQCKGCKHLFAYHKKFNTKNLYSGKYVEETYGSLGGIEKSFLKIRSLPKKKSDNFSRCNRLEKLIKFNKKLKVLDIGTGLGIFPYELSNRGYDVVCNDPDSKSVKFIKKYLKLEAILGNFLKIKVKKKFDVITFNKVLEHIEKPKLFILKSRSFLKTEGYLYLEVPDVLAINDKIRENREEFLMGHYHVFSKKSLKGFIESCNFKVLNLKSIRDPSGKYTIFAFAKKNK